ncbi:FecR family protein [Dyadobacter sp. 32]|uniref:FecR family protein n=1 Tax=Dyadobacter sp. 32 TaxID=538966 RepID=UPI0011EE2440
MKNYTNYESEDFVQDPYFRKWVLGKLPPDDGFWPTWQGSHPEQYEAIEQARNLIIAFQCNDIETNREEIRSAIDSILADSKLYPLPAFYQNWAWKIAASLLLITGLSLWHFKRQELVPVGLISSTKAEVNDGKSPRTFRLSDSTLVTLSPKSQLRIDSRFGITKREVFLTGEAFFNVARNTEKPFYVYTGEVVTRVLGTSFRVKAFSGEENVSVAVSTGKVTVFKQKSSNDAQHILSEEIILIPNQQAVYQKTGERLIKTLVENPAVLYAPGKRDVFEFMDTPIPQVLNQLESAYGVKIVFDEELLRDCNFTARLSNEPLFEKLNLVCETIHARYEVLDGQVVLYAQKCQDD